MRPTTWLTGTRSHKPCSPRVQVGYSKEVISRGQFAELLQDYRPFNDGEAAYFGEIAEFAYKSFRNRAAESRGMTPEEMQELAQGRVWSGRRAHGHRCDLAHKTIEAPCHMTALDAGSC
jgi:hypothetical protein